jgi:hypothetical protein
MSSSNLARAIVCFAVLAMTGEALAAKAVKKRHAHQAIVTENSDPDFLEMMGSVMTFPGSEAEKFQRVEPRRPTAKYLNVTSRPAGAQRTRVSLQGGGEATPYGFPGSNYRDDQIGFYKDNFVTYNNSPLNGYYGWYGQISP